MTAHFGGPADAFPRAQLYGIDIRALEPHAGRLRRALTAERLARMLSYRRAADRLRCLAGGLLLRHAAGAGAVTYGPYGKPLIQGGPEINLSHSGDYALLVVDAMPAGVDIEQWRDDDYRRLAALAFHPEERRELERECTARVFFDLWALKESYIKMLGRGFSLEPTGFRLCREGAGARLAAGGEGPARFRCYDQLPGYSVAVCLCHERWPEGIVLLDPGGMSASGFAEKKQNAP